MFLYCRYLQYLHSHFSLPSQTSFPATEIHLCLTSFTTATHIPFVKRLKVFILHFSPKQKSKQQTYTIYLVLVPKLSELRAWACVGSCNGGATLNTRARAQTTRHNLQNSQIIITVHVRALKIHLSKDIYFCLRSRPVDPNVVCSSVHQSIGMLK